MPTYPHEWLARQIVDQAPDAIVFADRDGVIRLWNAGAEAMFGYGVDEAVGQTLDLIIPERLRSRHWTGFHKTIATGVTRYARQVLAVPATRRTAPPSRWSSPSPCCTSRRVRWSGSRPSSATSPHAGRRTVR